MDKYFINSLREFPDDLEVKAYAVLPKILSEWRLYVWNYRIVDSRNYSGDFTLSPNYEYAKNELIRLSHRLPSAFVMDIGVCEKENVIIEFNDMFAIGNYGIDNETYLSMLKERYFEIIRSE